MRPILVLFALSLLTGSGVRATPTPSSYFPISSPRTTIDSVGAERRDGKFFVLHRVNQGQTLYAIARRYNTSVDFIKAANPGLANSVKSNQIVRIPQPEPDLSRKDERALRREEKAARKSEADEQLMKPDEPKPTAKTAKQEAKEDAKVAQRLETEARKNTDIHVVESGQTLYSLAVKYKVLMADLRRWNNLNNDNILLGQALIVSEKGYAARQAGPDDNTKADAKHEPAKKETAKTEPKPEAPARTEPSSKPESVSKPPVAEERPIKPGDPGNRLPTKGRRMAEIGMAERIESDESSNKYLALHRSAPVGSLVQVRNDINNQSLWVKVIGRLPNTGVNERVLIKLSAKAFEKLSPNNQSFRAEVSYIVP